MIVITPPARSAGERVSTVCCTRDRARELGVVPVSRPLEGDSASRMRRFHDLRFRWSPRARIGVGRHRASTAPLLYLPGCPSARSRKGRSFSAQLLGGGRQLLLITPRRSAPSSDGGGVSTELLSEVQRVSGAGVAFAGVEAPPGYPVNPGRPPLQDPLGT